MSSSSQPMQNLWAVTSLSEWIETWGRSWLFGRTPDNAPAEGESPLPNSQGSTKQNLRAAGRAGVGDVARQPGISDQTVFNGVVRPGHAIPEQHLWSVNDPSVGPTSGWVQGRGVRYE